MKVGAGLAKYKPLVVIIAVVLVAALAVNYRSPLGFMHIFMGLFFVVFAMFKLFDLPGFVQGFAMYDFPSQKFRQYAFAYPFIELLLGVAYLADFVPMLTDLATLIIMSVSAAGVLRALSSGMDVRCACLGTTLNVPLSTVSVLENIGMSLMALLGLFGLS